VHRRALAHQWRSAFMGGGSMRSVGVANERIWAVLFGRQATRSETRWFGLRPEWCLQ
jgi:hypothetical protein